VRPAGRMGPAARFALVDVPGLLFRDAPRPERRGASSRRFSDASTPGSRNLKALEGSTGHAPPNLAYAERRSIFAYGSSRWDASQTASSAMRLSRRECGGGQAKSPPEYPQIFTRRSASNVGPLRLGPALERFVVSSGTHPPHSWHTPTGHDWVRSRHGHRLRPPSECKIVRTLRGPGPDQPAPRRRRRL
jgi:hypothetical protein